MTTGNRLLRGILPVEVRLVCDDALVFDILKMYMNDVEGFNTFKNMLSLHKFPEKWDIQNALNFAKNFKYM